MPTFYDYETDTTTFSEPSESTEPAERVIPINSRPNRRHYRESLVGLGVLGVGLAVAFNFLGESAPAKSNKRTTASSPPTTIAPGITEPASFIGETCYTKDYTVQAGDTVFGISTQGLSGDPTFMNNTFTFNLSYLKDQARTNKALIDPNQLTPGEKFSIYDNCINISPLLKTYTFSAKDVLRGQLVYERALEYQSYQGRDRQNHHLVVVDYDSNTNGQFLNVANCMPNPRCASYVYGMPAHPAPDSLSYYFYQG